MTAVWDLPKGGWRTGLLALHDPRAMHFEGHAHELRSTPVKDIVAVYRMSQSATKSRMLPPDDRGRHCARRISYKVPVS